MSTHSLTDALVASVSRAQDGAIKRMLTAMKPGINRRAEAQAKLGEDLDWETQHLSKNLAQSVSTLVAFLGIHIKEHSLTETHQLPDAIATVINNGIESIVSYNDPETHNTRITELNIAAQALGIELGIGDEVDKALIAAHTLALLDTTKAHEFTKRITAAREGASAEAARMLDFLDLSEYQTTLGLTGGLIRILLHDLRAAEKADPEDMEGCSGRVLTAFHTVADALGVGREARLMLRRCYHDNIRGEKGILTLCQRADQEKWEQETECAKFVKSKIPNALANLDLMLGKSEETRADAAAAPTTLSVAEAVAERKKRHDGKNLRAALQFEMEVLAELPGQEDLAGALTQWRDTTVAESAAEDRPKLEGEIGMIYEAIAIALGVMKLPIPRITNPARLLSEKSTTARSP